MRLNIKQADDNDLLPHIGHDFLKVTSDYAGDAAWEFNKDYRILDFQDIGMNPNAISNWDESGFGKPDWINEDGSRSQSVVSRFLEQQDAAGGFGTGWLKEYDGPKMSIQAANDKYGLNGMLTFDREITEAEAQILHQRKIREMKFHMVANQAKGFTANAEMMIQGIGSALWDPVNLGAMFIPIVGQGSFFLNAMARGVWWGKTLTRTRLAYGAMQGSLWTTAFEIPAAAQKFYEKADYSYWDSALNILAGGALGGGLYAGGGRAWGWFRGVPHKRHEAALRVAAAQFAEGKDVNVNALIRAARNVAKDTPDVTLMSDIDAAKVQRAYNKETGYVPPLLAHIPPESEGKTMGEIHEGGGINTYNMPDWPLRVDDFDITPNSKLGHNQGSIIIHKTTGDRWYYKSHKDATQSGVEFISSVIAKKLLGDLAPEVRVVTKNGKIIGVASKWKKGKPLTLGKLRALKVSNPKAYSRLVRSSIVHAWLGNREWANPKNLVIDGAGNVHSIDTSGSLNYHGSGKKKTDYNGSVLEELFHFLDGRNPEIKAILEGMTMKDFAIAVQTIYRISDNQLNILFLAFADHPAIGPKRARMYLAALKNRRDRLASYKNFLLSGKRVENLKFNWAGFPSKLRKAWFKLSAGKRDLSWTGVDEVTDHPTKNIGLLSDAAKRSLPDEQFRSLYTAKEIDDYVKKALNKYYEKLTNDEKQAMHMWRQGTGFQRALNEFVADIRTGRLLPSPDQMNTKYRGFKMSELLDTYISLKSAIDKFQLEDSFKMWVAKSTANIKGIRGLKFGPQRIGEESSLIGKRIASDTFLNASFDYNVSQSFLMHKAAFGQGGHPLLIELYVPKETRMALLEASASTKLTKGEVPFAPDTVSSIVHRLYEAEILMHPETQILVSDARWTTHTFADGTKFKALKVTGEVVRKGEKPISKDSQLADANFNHYHNKSIVSADVKLSPETAKLSKREEVLKVEKNPQATLKKNIEEAVEELVADLKNRGIADVNDSVTRINNDFSDQVAKDKLITKAMDAVKSCIRGKV